MSCKDAQGCCTLTPMSELTAGGRPDLEWDMQDRLKKAMRVAGFSTSQLAEQLGVHRNTVTNCLSGRSLPDRRTLIAWAFATGVPVEWLETGQETTGDTPGGPPRGRVTRREPFARIAA